MVLVAVCMAVGGVLGAWFAANAAMNFGADLRKIEKGGTPFSIFFIFVSILQKTQL